MFVYSFSFSEEIALCGLEYAEKKRFHVVIPHPINGILEIAHDLKPGPLREKLLKNVFKV